MKFVLTRRKLIALLLCVTMLFSIAPFGPLAAFGESQGDSNTHIIHDVTNGGDVTLPQNDKVTLTVTGGDSCQWQIEAYTSTTDTMWVDIYGATGNVLELSYAMVANVLTDYQTAKLRCKTGYDTYTGEVNVTVSYKEESSVQISDPQPVTVISDTVVEETPQDEVTEEEPAEEQPTDGAAAEEPAQEAPSDEAAAEEPA